MKLTWKNTACKKIGNKRSTILRYPNLPFENQADGPAVSNSDSVDSSSLDNSRLSSDPSSDSALADAFLEQDNKFAQDGRYLEALRKWEAAITLTPQKAVLHEQKAQVLLEIEDAWGALKAATRATELEPSWSEGWITLGRAQLNFGEPDSAVESFDKALALQPESTEARDDRQMALHLIKRRKQLHSSGIDTSRSRFVVGDKLDST
ncbi:hypothetical protein Nepgr_002758 [Nepenthes gracilis]|uniref:Tetratricopeptide repeat protein 33 n=1 Tax=Nepenthes gracilis TaxID=150966 RepID=A0AAD3RY12_NEPGR|nr:hypothetical protein Nepgr_002758 [Nepenthes gracilis]